MLHDPKKTQCFARQLRRRMTLPEILLWQALRRRPAGLRFRRQHPAGIYVLDFFCPASRLAVEVDGEKHARGDQPERDAARDDWLGKQGVRVRRIPAQTILSDLEAAIRHIVVTARGDYPSTGFAGPPPPPGEECARREGRQSGRELPIRFAFQARVAGLLRGKQRSVQRLAPRCAASTIRKMLPPHILARSASE